MFENRRTFTGHDASDAPSKKREVAFQSTALTKIADGIQIQKMVLMHRAFAGPDNVIYMKDYQIKVLIHKALAGPDFQSQEPLLNVTEFQSTGPS